MRLIVSGRQAVLDHGYVELVEAWGSDERIVEAARMSTGRGFKGWGPKECRACGAGTAVPRGGPGSGFPPSPCCKGTGQVPGDEKLLRFLWEHQHRTPFEMAGMTVEVQAPIFVFREWHRHRTQSYNEMSARYTPLPDVNYVPSVERLMMPRDARNKQAAGVADVEMTVAGAEAHRAMLVELYAALERTYQASLGEGIPKELARIVLPVGRYSRMRASANLRNWLAFLTLRLDPAAQWEIREYADAVGKLVVAAFPRTWELFAEGLR